MQEELKKGREGGRREAREEWREVKCVHELKYIADLFANLIINRLNFGPNSTDNIVHRLFIQPGVHKQWEECTMCGYDSTNRENIISIGVIA